MPTKNIRKDLSQDPEALYGIMAAQNSALALGGAVLGCAVRRAAPSQRRRGQWAMMKVDPALAARTNRCRRQIAYDMTARWGAGAHKGAVHTKH